MNFAVRSKEERPLRVIKRQLGYQKVCFEWLAKNAIWILTLLRYQTYGWQSECFWPMRERCVHERENSSGHDAGRTLQAEATAMQADLLVGGVPA